MHDPRTGVEQRLPGVGATQLGCHVHAAEEQGVQTATAMSDVMGGLETGVGLDDDVQARVVTALAQQAVQPHHLVGGAHFRQHQRRRRRVAGKHRLHIGEAERLAHAIDAHDALDAVIGLRLGEQRHRVGPRSRLVLRRDAVLQLDTDNVSAARERLGVHRRPQSGREDEASTGSDGTVAHDMAEVEIPGDRVSAGRVRL